MTTLIEWAEETWNPVTGCSKISEGCAHCYAERMAKRLAGRYGYPKDDPFKPTFHADKLGEPLRWKKSRRVFAVSMGDLFHSGISFDTIAAIFGVMAFCQNHIFIVLTKRPDRAADFFNMHDGSYRSNLNWWENEACSKLPHSMTKGIRLRFDNSTMPLPNVWFGTTIENQKRADERIPFLLQIPAAVRFVSVEPMLGNVNAMQWFGDYYSSLHGGFGRGIDWVICGGESGPGARPMHPDWARSLRDQCIGAGVPFFFKQWGEYGTDFYRVDTGEMVFRRYENFNQWVNKPNWCRGGVCLDVNGMQCKTGIAMESAEYPVAIMHKLGKNKSGRILDGRTWDEYPATNQKQ